MSNSKVTGGVGMSVVSVFFFFFFESNGNPSISDGRTPLKYVNVIIK